MNKFLLALISMTGVAFAFTGPNPAYVDCNKYLTAHTYTIGALAGQTNCPLAESGMNQMFQVVTPTNESQRNAILQVDTATNGSIAVTYVRQRNEALVWSTWESVGN